MLLCYCTIVGQAELLGLRRQANARMPLYQSSRLRHTVHELEVLPVHVQVFVLVTFRKVIFELLVPQLIQLDRREIERG